VTCTTIVGSAASPSLQQGEPLTASPLCPNYSPRSETLSGLTGSLYLVGKILHREVSENNIIIAHPHRANWFTGMLIDLDLAKQVGSSRSGARHQTGTMEFMAIDVLRKAAHTFRHDLKSFFYVPFSFCGRRVLERGFICDPESRPSEDVLTAWNRSSFDKIVRGKLGPLHVDGFRRLLAQFPPSFACFKPLW
jgi:serine/threonine protein kinase